MKLYFLGNLIVENSVHRCEGVHVEQHSLWVKDCLGLCWHMDTIIKR